MGHELARRQDAFRQGIEYRDGSPDSAASQLPLHELPRFWLLRWIVRHWRGWYSLGVSYWLNGLPRTVLLISLLAINRMRVVLVHRWDIWTILLTEIVLLMFIWLGVGVWRSAQRHIADTGRRFWARCAQGVVIVGAVVTTSTVVTTASTLFQLIAMYRTIDSMSPLVVTVDPRAEKLFVSGALARGSGDVIADAIAAHPDLRVVQLSSPGGLLDEARIAGQAIKSRRLTTFVATECDSACTLMFMSGTQRVLYRSAVLGFHSPVMAPMTVANLFAYAAQMRNELVQLGATADFAALASSVDSRTLWRPNVQMMLDNHVATGVVEIRNWMGS